MIAARLFLAGAGVLELCGVPLRGDRDHRAPVRRAYRGATRYTHSTQQLTERDAIISAHNLRFESALNNMTQGLCFFDGEERLIVCNRRYLELYGLNAERVRPGVTLGEILDMRMEAGTATSLSKAEYLAWRSSVASANGPSESVHELGNGRVYAIRYRPMADGAWVATTDDITERHRLKEQLEENHSKIAHMATHDALTGLANRVLFRQQLDRAVSAARAGDGGIAVLMLDLNKFKQVNDTLGHPVGDLLLVAVAERLSGCVREHDAVARLGGDEFAIVLHVPDPAATSRGPRQAHPAGDRRSVPAWRAPRRDRHEHWHSLAGVALRMPISW